MSNQMSNHVETGRIGGMSKLLGERTATACGCVTLGKIVRGMCVKHYDKWVQSTPKDQRGPAPRFQREFWQFVDKSGECWLWTGPVNAQGYGWWSNGAERGLAHRISLASVTPLMDKSLLACHRCDNPPCVNPAHLYWGTLLDNARDVAERGTPRNGNSVKTHCKRGHEFAGDNLQIVGKRRGRQCRTCGNENSRRTMAARRARKALAA